MKKVMGVFLMLASLPFAVVCGFLTLGGFSTITSGPFLFDDPYTFLSGAGDIMLGALILSVGEFLLITGLELFKFGTFCKREMSTKNFRGSEHASS